MNRVSFQTKAILCLAALSLCLSILAMTCREREQTSTSEEIPMPTRNISDVLKDHTDELMSIPGVVGLYEGVLENGTPCIKVMVVAHTPELQGKIPQNIESHPVVIEVTGEIRPMK